jgi:hypothetical protein
MQLLLDFWRFACCPEPPPLQLQELQALVAFHTAAERIMADFVMRATSDRLPDSLHSPPRLLSREEAGRIMAGLSAAEKARIHRAFYRGQLLNWFFTSPVAPTLDDRMTNRVKALCLWATWTGWEIREILTVHAYFRHQHELILEQVNSDFLRQLEASAPEYESPDDYFEIRSSILHPPFETCICVDSTCVSDPQVNLYIERQTCLGLNQLYRFLRQDRLGQRRLVRSLYHACSPPLTFESQNSYFSAAIETREQSLFAWAEKVTGTVRYQHNGPGRFPGPRSSALLDQPPAGWTRYQMEIPSHTAYTWDGYAHSLLTGLVFWDSDRLDDMHRRVRESVGEAAIWMLDFPTPNDYFDPERRHPRSLQWWFTVPPKPLPLLDGATIQALRAEFGCMCDASTEHGDGQSLPPYDGRTSGRED